MIVHYGGWAGMTASLASLQDARGSTESKFTSTFGSSYENKFCSLEGHFTISFKKKKKIIVSGKVTRRCPQITTMEEKGKKKRNRTSVLLPFTNLTPYR